MLPDVSVSGSTLRICSPRRGKISGRQVQWDRRQEEALNRSPWTFAQTHRRSRRKRPGWTTQQASEPLASPGRGGTRRADPPTRRRTGRAGPNSAQTSALPPTPARGRAVCRACAVQRCPRALPSNCAGAVRRALRGGVPLRRAQAWGKTRAGIGCGTARRDVPRFGPDGACALGGRLGGWGAGRGQEWPLCLICALAPPGHRAGRRHHEDLDFGARLWVSLGWEQVGGGHGATGGRRVGWARSRGESPAPLRKLPGVGPSVRSWARAPRSPGCGVQGHDPGDAPKMGSQGTRPDGRGLGTGPMRPSSGGRPLGWRGRRRARGPWQPRSLEDPGERRGLSSFWSPRHLQVVS